MGGLFGSLRVRDEPEHDLLESLSEIVGACWAASLI
jgi:hypothetical protein